MNREHIKALALAKGFKLKDQPDGKADLNPYVYDFAEAVAEQSLPQGYIMVPAQAWHDLVQAEHHLNTLIANLAVDNYAEAAEEIDTLRTVVQRGIDAQNQLAEMQAQAGRDGFVECYFALRRAEYGDVFDLVKSADEYANKIRQAAKAGDL